MLGTHVHARRQRERPNLCSYSYRRLNGSDLVGCWGSEYKGLALDTMPGREGEEQGVLCEGEV